MRDPRALRSLLAIAVAAACVRAAVADDAAAGYAAVRPALVKVWAFDQQGRPIDSGSGVVIVSNGARSLVLTATHVIASAASIRIDLDRDRHDIAAHVEDRGPRDLSVLELDRGGLPVATFAPRTRVAVEGNLIAVAGFVERDELIGVVGQEPRLLYPGTISSRPENGAYLELENVHIEEGLSGAPVFDPDTGDVLGIVTSRTSDQRGGFADAASLVVEPFLASHAIAFAEHGSSARPVKTAVAAPVTRVNVPAPAHAPAALTLLAVARAAPVVTPAPHPLPSLDAGPRAWAADGAAPQRFVYDREGCAIVLSLAVAHVRFGVPAAGARNADLAGDRLTLRIGRRAAPVSACANVADRQPATAEYRAAAVSYDGHHVTIRFRHASDDASAADDALFPDDVSVDADLDAADVRAHVQLIGDDWADALDVSAARDP